MPSKENGRRCLLYGKLYVAIHETRNLRTKFFENLLSKGPNATTRSVPKRIVSQLKKLVQSPTEVATLGLYATVDLERARVARTRRVQISKQNTNPRWEEKFHIYCAHELVRITFTIKDDRPLDAVLIGRAHVPAEDVLTKGYRFDGWVDIVNENGDPIQGNPQIHVRMEFMDVTQDRNWSQGIKSPLFEGVPDTFFLQRQHCKVTLYHDAHVGEDFGHPIGSYKPRRCWEDIYDAISNAKHLVYIAGWSVFFETTLVREENKNGYNIRLGDLLKKKADEGVTVLMLIWDDRTSVKQLNQDGMMGTHDQETENFFRNTKVRCVLCPRNPDSGRSMVQEVKGSLIFTHHQKTIVVDAEESRIVSFVGGIDLCDGRYDTQDHPLFKTLDTVHRKDFHQPNFTGASIEKGGPREPWHDIHCRLEGPVAWDVLYNFEQRWTKQVDDKRLSRTQDHRLLRKVPPPSPITSSQDDPERWSVQLFRSIDSGSVAFDFPNDLRKNPTRYGLVSEKDCIIDRGIQDAYINAIRRARNFIYIENQYFLGSSFGWNSKDIIDPDIGALHLIPKELSLKIVSKIEAGERFSVYVIIPMWPEGIPGSASVQAILDWQRRTIEMMYVDIGDALRKNGSPDKPTDYLAFFCLGNRETESASEFKPTRPPEKDTDYYRAQQARRFMIYVHSKMMIVDDEYIIVGSANINQRSMDGSRDTEIAMGAFQPNHLATDFQPPAKGQIHGFRLSLWHEHLGDEQTDTSLFDRPERLQCIRKVTQVADQNWKLYTSSRIGNLPSHLLRYPLEMKSSDDRSGNVMKLTGLMEHFPDTNAPILGKPSPYLDPNLTT